MSVQSVDFKASAQKASNERDLLVLGKVSCDTYASPATKLRSHLDMAMHACG